ncbi:Lar family restriction alleviation protein [Gluconacetobacter azotocaptans]|nr:Lar family restriction alleviation protein [Gluconacetobacter azotocaptans]
MPDNQTTKYSGARLDQNAADIVTSVIVKDSGGDVLPIPIQDYISKGVQPPLSAISCQYGRPYLVNQTVALPRKLDPCPFCGGTDVEEDENEEYIACYTCGASGPMKTENESPTVKWNTRNAICRPGDPNEMVPSRHGRRGVRNGREHHRSLCDVDRPAR